MRLLTSAIIILVAASSSADSITRTISGNCDNGEPIAGHFTINFTQTGGDYNLGTGTARVEFTLQNTSGLVGPLVPVYGNGVLTRFRFNVPGQSNVTLASVVVLAGSRIISRGITLNGDVVPAGCTTLTTDEDHTNWYELDASGVGALEFARNTFETDKSKDGGGLDPGVVPICGQELGDFFPDLVIAGEIKLVIDLDNLNNSFVSAGDFLGLCSAPPGGQNTEAFSMKWQDVGPNAANRCRLSDLGACSPISVQGETWSNVKVLYSN